MEEFGGAARLEGMSEEFDEQTGPEQDDVEAHGAETDVKPDVEPDDDSDVEGHLFQRR